MLILVRFTILIGIATHKVKNKNEQNTSNNKILRLVKLAIGIFVHKNKNKQA